MRRHIVKNASCNRICPPCAFQTQLRAPSTLSWCRHYIKTAEVWEKSKDIPEEVLEAIEKLKLPGYDYANVESKRHHNNLARDDGERNARRRRDESKKLPHAQLWHSIRMNKERLQKTQDRQTFAAGVTSKKELASTHAPNPESYVRLPTSKTSKPMSCKADSASSPTTDSHSRRSGMILADGRPPTAPTKGASYVRGTLGGNLQHSRHLLRGPQIDSQRRLQSTYSHQMQQLPLQAWTCETCDTLHKYSMPSCPYCNHPRRDRVESRGLEIDEQEIDLLQKKLNRSNGSFRPDWACTVCSSRNLSQQDRCRKCEASRPEVKEWVCQQCQSTKDTFELQCPECRPEALSAENGTVTLPEWPNLRKKRSSGEMVASENKDLGATIDKSSLSIDGTPTETEQSPRLRDAVNDTFVAFRCEVQGPEVEARASKGRLSGKLPGSWSSAQSSTPHTQSANGPGSISEAASTRSESGKILSSLTFDNSLLDEFATMPSHAPKRRSRVNPMVQSSVRSYSNFSHTAMQSTRKQSSFSDSAHQQPTWRYTGDRENRRTKRSSQSAETQSGRYGGNGHHRPTQEISRSTQTRHGQTFRNDIVRRVFRNNDAPSNGQARDGPQPDTAKFSKRQGRDRKAFDPSFLDEPSGKGVGGGHPRPQIESQLSNPEPVVEPPIDLETAFDPSFLDVPDSEPDMELEQRSVRNKGASSGKDQSTSKVKHHNRAFPDHDFLDDDGDKLPARRKKGAKKSGSAVQSAPYQKDDYDDAKLEKIYDEVLSDSARDWGDSTSARSTRKRKQAPKTRSTPTRILLPEFISVTNLAAVLKTRVEEFLKKMRDLGFHDLNHDHILDAETAGLIAAEFNYEAVFSQTDELDLKPQPPAPDKSLLPPRPPVITIMGHVDHGKTTLLDYLRKSSVAASEHGGITQHIGAFSVPLSSDHNGRTITFLDTPGHEAFLAMRQRGANVTDIVILVVAADDSVKPQTIEAIKHAQGANVPIVVAISKVDKPDADIDRAKQDLARHGVEIEDYGGDTQVVCVSGKTGQGMQELEDAVVALADILDMRAEAEGCAVEGWILESTTTKAGRIATVLVRRGTIHIGDVIVAGMSWARVRGLRNEAGTAISSAGPGSPVEIDGWRAEPVAGDEMLQANDEQQAKDVVDYRIAQLERLKSKVDIAAVNTSRVLHQSKRDALTAEKEAAKASGMSLKSFKAGLEPTTQAAADTDAYTAVLSATTASTALPDPPTEQQQATENTTGPKILNLILKADVSGSLEALSQSITTQLTFPHLITPSILRSSVGAPTESDIQTAALARATIVAFNVDVEGGMRRQAETLGVQIVEQRIIYRIVEGVKGVMEGMLEGITKTRVVGEGEVGQVFELKGKRGKGAEKVAGVRVRNGVLKRAGKVRVLRGGLGAEGTEVFDGTMSSLKHVKKDVTEMRKGTECGVGFEGWQAFEVGDQIQCYEEFTEKRTL